MLGLLIRGLSWQFEDSGIIATLATAAAYITFVLYEELLESPVYFEVNDRFIPRFFSSRITRRTSFGCLNQADNQGKNRSAAQDKDKNN